MPIEISDSQVVLTHPNGASATVLLFGAHIVSWKSPSQSGGDTQERLFVSKKAAFDGVRAIRGGIPVIFPIFANAVRPEHSKMAAHGFARTTKWEYEKEVIDNEAGVSVRFKLEPTDEISRVFPYPFTLSYVVTLAAHQLSSDFHVGNPSKDATLAFQAVLHTYYAANASSVKIKSLKGLQYVNKVKGGVEETETRDIVDVSTFTDSIYRDAPDDIVATWEGGGVELKKRHLKDVVVWNPAQEAGSKIGDMEDGGWERFVCIEAGSASYFVEVAPGENWVGGQTATAL